MVEEEKGWDDSKENTLGQSLFLLFLIIVIIGLINEFFNQYITPILLAYLRKKNSLLPWPPF